MPKYHLHLIRRDVVEADNPDEAIQKFLDASFHKVEWYEGTDEPD